MAGNAGVAHGSRRTELEARANPGGSLIDLSDVLVGDPGRTYPVATGWTTPEQHHCCRGNALSMRPEHVARCVYFALDRKVFRRPCDQDHGTDQANNRHCEEQNDISVHSRDSSRSKAIFEANNYCERIIARSQFTVCDDPHTRPLRFRGLRKVVMVALPGLEPGLFALRGRFLEFAGTCTELH
jgi:hypothetical protein